mgnify:CR=1 FL=1
MIEKKPFQEVIKNLKAEGKYRVFNDILREEKQSDSFFDDKMNFLLGVTNKTTKN